MKKICRRNAVALCALPFIGCSIQPLGPLRSSTINDQVTLHLMLPPHIGKSWTYKVINHYNGYVLDTICETVTELEPVIRISRESSTRGKLDDEIQNGWGFIKQEPTWEMLQIYENAVPVWPQNLSLGIKDRYSTHYFANQGSFRYWISFISSVSSFERLELEIGTFDTIKIDKLIRLGHPDTTRTNLIRRETLWLAPSMGRWVVKETNGSYVVPVRRPYEGREDHLRWVLTSYSST